MQPNQHNPSRYDASPRVRQNAGSAAFAAACLLFFGFFWFVLPTVTNLFSLGDAICNYTLRFGGIAMAVAAVWSWTGRPKALLFDAITSVPIGLLLIASAVLMMLGGGFGLNQLLYILFGGMFIAAGVRNWRDYHALTGPGGDGAGGGPAAYDPGFEERYREARVEPPGSSLASQLLERADKKTDTRAAREPPAPAGAGDRIDCPGARGDSHTSEPRTSARANSPESQTPPRADVPAASVRQQPETDVTAESAGTAKDSTPEDIPEPPAEGFLAALAKKDPPDNP